MTRPKYGTNFDPKAWADLEKRAAQSPASPGETRRQGPDALSVTVELHPVMVALLDVTSAHLRKSRSEAVADGLRCLFASLPRPDD